MDNNRYSRGKIYKIVDNTNGNIYVGSTCEASLCRRIQKHKGAYKSWLKGNRQGKVRSFEILKNNDYKIILLENCPCETKDQLLAREQHWIDSLVCINKNNAYHCKLEYDRKWRDKNREKIRLSNLKFNEKNKDKKRAQNKLYRYSVSVGYINKIDPFLFLID